MPRKSQNKLSCLPSNRIHMQTTSMLFSFPFLENFSSSFLMIETKKLLLLPTITTKLRVETKILKHLPMASHSWKKWSSVVYIDAFPFDKDMCQRLKNMRLFRWVRFSSYFQRFISVTVIKSLDKSVNRKPSLLKFYSLIVSLSLIYVFIAIR